MSKNDDVNVEYGAEVEHSASEILGVEPKPWQRARFSTRTKPIFDAAALARQYLDEMEEDGRLHNKKHRDN